MSKIAVYLIQGITAFLIAAIAIWAINVTYSRLYNQECKWRPPEWRAADSNCR